MNEDDALQYMIHWLRGRLLSPIADPAFDVSLRSAIREYIKQYEKVLPQDLDHQMNDHSPPFLAAAWELSRRGIIRPGVTRLGIPLSPGTIPGEAYSFTPLGQRWLAEADRAVFIPTEPSRFAALLKPFDSRFGPGFFERGQQAHRCYSALAYLACCAMCGAAAESILLALANAKKDERDVLKDYGSRGGRGRVENLVLENAGEDLKKEFRGYTGLLKYWRDEASHGRESGIGEIEAFTSLQSLLRLAQCANDHWEELVRARA